MSYSELPVIDLELGAKLLGSNEQVAKTMIKELIAILPENLQALKAAYTEANLKKLADIAHYVHGGSCYCGTPRLKSAAMALEKQAKTAPSVQALQAAYQQLCQEILNVIAQANSWERID